MCSPAQYGYRVVATRSAADARAALADAHVDRVIAEDDGGTEGSIFLAVLAHLAPRTSSACSRSKPQSDLAPQALSAASIYQFVRKPLDADQVGLVKRALETRELARRSPAVARVQVLRRLC